MWDLAKKLHFYSLKCLAQKKKREGVLYNTERKKKTISENKSVQARTVMETFALLQKALNIFQ